MYCRYTPNPKYDRGSYDVSHDVQTFGLRLETQRKGHRQNEQDTTTIMVSCEQ